ncbi:macro domain-containing protein [Geovibrio thiophilus]|uniref:Macro domain-containing protein n=1 Tax=Geovibrio thiophilus TaxID=139438 RepID=A0A3R5Y6T8_9BACT|nr:macro domain-containing protein [Geovibrio thiophilus]QAR33095.1 macro domain-containing protein [Geovibrio thiophilus]
MLKILVNGVTLGLIKGDITETDTDAIVNAANTNLKLGTGVAGAIKAKGGESIQKECDAIGYCPLGSAVITGGGDLKVKFVIHAVGPRYGIDPAPDKNLYGAVFSSLMTAETKGLTSISLPAISMGINGFPEDEAAGIIIKAITDFAEHSPETLKKIVICLFSDKDLAIFEKAAAKKS